MLTIRYQAAFKKDYKRIVKRGCDVRLLEEVITLLAEQKPLPEACRAAGDAGVVEHQAEGLSDPVCTAYPISSRSSFLLWTPSFSYTWAV